jgi:hypothetical protein
MSRKTRNLIWPLPGMATFAIVAALAILVALPVGILLAQNETMGEAPGNLMAVRDTTNPYTQINLSWEASPAIEEDASTTETELRSAPSEYRVDISTDGMSWTLLTDTATDKPGDAAGIQFDHGAANGEPGALMAGAMYYYRVFGNYGVEELSPPAITMMAASTAPATRPDPPSIGEVAAIDDDDDEDTPESPQNTIVVNWTRLAAGGVPQGTMISGYRIEYSSNMTGPWTATMMDAADDTTFHNHTDLEPGTTMYYRVSAIAQGAMGTDPVVGFPSGVRSGTTADATPTPPGAPGVPTGLVAVGGAGKIDLYWNGSTMTDDMVDGYRIQGRIITEGRPLDEADWLTLEDDTGNDNTTWEHMGLGNNSTWEYRVYSLNGTTPSDAATTPTAQATTIGPSRTTLVPLAPDWHASNPLTDAPPAQEVIVLEWMAAIVDDGDPAVTGYQIVVSNQRGAARIVLVANTEMLDSDTTPNTIETTYSDKDLMASQTRCYVIKGINSNGVGLASQERCATTTPGTLPSAPLRVTAAANSASQITVTWDAPSDPDGAPVTGYLIERSTDGSSWGPPLVANTEDLASDTTDDVIEATFVDMMVMPEMTYHYRVRAINMVGIGPASSTTGDDNMATTPETADDTPPGDASLLTGAVSGTDINLSWTAGANAQFHRVFGIRENADGSLDYSDYVWEATDATGSATVDMTGKASGTWQFFVIAGRGTSADDSDAVWSASWSPVHKVTY